MLVALALLVVPLLRELPLGHGTRTGLLAWMLVALALYWLYAGMGYRPLLRRGRVSHRQGPARGDGRQRVGAASSRGPRTDPDRRRPGRGQPAGHATPALAQVARRRAGIGPPGVS